MTWERVCKWIWRDE